MTTITRRLVESDYDITDAEVRELCETKLASGEVDKNLNDGYFKVLYKRTVSLLNGKVYNKDVEGRMCALDTAHDVMYGIVIDVINGMPDCAPDHNDSKEVKKEKALRRNERSNYARSAKSAIAKAIGAGIAIEDKRPDMVGKTALEKEATQITKLQRSTKELTYACVNRLVDLMAKLKGEDAAAHATVAQTLKSFNW